MVVVALAMLRQLRHPLPEHDRQRPAELPRQPERRAWRTPRRRKSALADIRGGPATASAPGADAARAPAADRRRHGSHLPVLGTAPEFVGNQQWFNTPGDRPLTLRALRGRVVLVDFWTYSCINCIRTLPYLKAWDAKLPQGRPDDRRRPHARVPVRARGEQRRGSDRRKRDPLPGRPGQRTGDLERLRQPVLAGRVLHRRPGQRPLRPLRRGRIRREREGDPRAAGRSRARRSPARRPGSTAIAPSATVTTPETYLGAARAERFTNAMLSPGLHDFTAPAALPANEFAYHGKWRIALDSATAAAAPRSTSTSAPGASTWCSARPGTSRRVRVLLDGKPISGADAGSDVHGGAVTVTAQRLYNLVELPRVGHHVLTLDPEAGVRAMPSPSASAAAAQARQSRAMAELCQRHRAGRRRRADDPRGRRPLHGAGRL